MNHCASVPRFSLFRDLSKIQNKALTSAKTETSYDKIVYRLQLKKSNTFFEQLMGPEVPRWRQGSETLSKKGHCLLKSRLANTQQVLAAQWVEVNMS